MKKALREMTVVKAILAFFSYRSFVSNAPTAHHYITLHIGIVDEHFLAHIMPFFDVQWDTFKKCHSCSLFLCGPATGQRAVFGPLQRYQWPADAFRKNIRI